MTTHTPEKLRGEFDHQWTAAEVFAEANRHGDHVADMLTAYANLIERSAGGTVNLPIDWRREGMVVVVDSDTGQLLGCMGKNTLAVLDAKCLIAAAPTPAKEG